MNVDLPATDKKGAEFTFHFFSKLYHRRLVSADGARVGRLDDLVFQLKEPYPEAVGIYYEPGYGRPAAFIPWAEVVSLGPGAVTVAGDGAPAHTAFVDQPGWLLLDRHLIGRSILDIDGRRTEVVNDAHLLESNGRMALVDVDASFNGFLRRWTRGRLDPLRDRLISWKYVQPLNIEDAAATDAVSLSLKREQLADLPSQDLADVLEELSGKEQQALFHALDDDKAADALLDAEPRAQRQIIASMRKERAGAILSELSVMQLAELFSVLPHEQVSEFLALLPEDEATRVSGILKEREANAGVLLSRDFVAMAAGTTVGDALESLRRSDVEKHVISYVYVVDGGGVLEGVVDLRELVLAPDSGTLGALMTTPVVSAEVSDVRDDLGQLFLKYHYRLLPVVDAHGRLMGTLRYQEVMKPATKRGTESQRFRPL